MRNTSYIQALYEKVERERRPSYNYNMLRNQLIRDSEKLERQLSAKQKRKFNELLELENRMCADQTRELFKEGFRVAFSIMREVNKK